MNIIELIQRAKFLAHDPQLDESALTTEVSYALPVNSWMDALHDAQTYFENTMLEKTLDYFAHQTTITYSAGTETYTLPGNMVQLRLLERVDTDHNYNLHPVSIVEKNEYHNFSPVYQKDPIVYSFWGDRIRIGDYTSSGTLNIFYIRRLPKLFYGTVTVPTTTSIVLPASPDIGRAPDDRDDYYNGAELRIVSVTGGAGTGSGQRIKINDYTGLTRTCTVDAPAVAVSGTTIKAELICEIPEQHHLAVAAFAAVLQIISDKKDVPADLRALAEKLEAAMVKTITPRNSDESRGINVPYDYGYLG